MGYKQNTLLLLHNHLQIQTKYIIITSQSFTNTNKIHYHYFTIIYKYKQNTLSLFHNHLQIQTKYIIITSQSFTNTNKYIIITSKSFTNTNKIHYHYFTIIYKYKRNTLSLLHNHVQIQTKYIIVTSQSFTN